MPIPINEFPAVPAMSYIDARQEIRSGDILLCSGNALFSRLIKFATKSIWSHVGFVLRVDAIDRIMVMESVEDIGVRTVPLSSYLYNYNGSRKPYNGKMLIARHNAFKPDYVHDLSRGAVDLLGYPYDNAEIAKITGRLAGMALGFNNQTRELKDNGAYICSEYAYYPQGTSPKRLRLIRCAFWLNYWVIVANIVANMAFYQFISFCHKIGADCLLF
jgi:hypothetical protein